MPDPTAVPAAFRHAVAELSGVRPRPELIVSPLEAPPRLAPFTWAVSAEADVARRPGEDLDEPDTSGRLILLHDPAGQDAWEGTFRLVCFTVTQTSSVRFGDIAGPRRDDDVELRASWTPAGTPEGAELHRHAEAFHTLISTAAGLPPVGTAQLADKAL